MVFSKQAVICERNRRLCLLIRMGDMRDDSFIVNAQVSVKVIRRKVGTLIWQASMEIIILNFFTINLN